MTDLTQSKLIELLAAAREAKERARKSGSSRALLRHQSEESRLYRQLRKFTVETTTH